MLADDLTKSEYEAFKKEWEEITARLKNSGADLSKIIIVGR